MKYLSRARRKSSISPDPTTCPNALVKKKLSGKLSSIHIQPERIASDELVKPSPTFFARIKPRELAHVLYHWAACLFIVGLVCSQLLGAVWGSQTTVSRLHYGRNPLLGPAQIVGTNDIPFPDRVVACVRRGQFYEPELVSSLLAAPGVSAILEDSTGTAVHGYRLRQRGGSSVPNSLDSTVQAVLESSCALIAKTIDNIAAACVELGYTNLTRDSLRVVDDWDSTNLYNLPNTLPVLIMPYYGSAAYARHAIPTWGGDACMFRLEDAYSLVDGDSTVASFRGVNQSVRYERTIQWLGRPGGQWKNGWYEDAEGMRWYSDLAGSTERAPFYMKHRMFDMRSGEEQDCSDPSDCEAVARVGRWGDKFTSFDKGHKFSTVYIANGTEYGLFIYDAYELHTVRIVFDWETLVSNLSVALVLMRWILALVSLHTGAYRGKSLWFSGGIGCISGAGSFAYLPIASLPRLKMILAAFWTVGCRFEGQQAGLAEAWFVMYPAIATFVLIYFSLLNFLAKALRRRMSDALFTPTVIALCSLHYFRLEIAESGWLTGVDGRVVTLVLSDEVDRLVLADYFTSDLAWRINGRVSLIFSTKWAILGINLLPLLVARSFPVGAQCADLKLHGVERALGLRAKHVGGLGLSLTYVVATVDQKEHRISSLSFTRKLVATQSEKHIIPEINEFLSEVTKGRSLSVAPHLSRDSGRQSAKEVNKVAQDNRRTSQEMESRDIALVNSFELVRLGYLVFGDRYLITFDEWDILSSMAPFRSFCHFWNHRVLVWTLRPVNADRDAEIAGGRALQWIEPQMWRLDDPRLQSVRWWQVSACSIQC